MLRTFWVILVAVAASLFFGTAVMVVTVVSSTTRVIDALIRAWARTIVRAAGIRLGGDGIERIHPDQRYILIANHYSYFDIPCILAAIPQPIRFMAKVSLFKIPIFGWALGRAGFIPIDRKNRRTAVKSFDLAAERIRRGNTIVVFPEEGRTRTREMRPFQRGAFLLAMKSELAILPLAIDGTYDVLRVGSKRITPGTVTIRVGTEIPTAGASLRDKERLAVAARGQISALLNVSAEESAETPRPASTRPNRAT
ncbi:MAG TPA: lysophospholipid acyltransferase family protein [Thermoanaerobaculia bacterium]|nr:lysophospholipid acyltransferase family protein [Thermoanaerobaculia bacterium]